MNWHSNTNSESTSIIADRHQKSTGIVTVWELAH